MKKLIAGILVLFLLPNPALSAELWGPASAGMTIKEVMRVIDDAYRLDEEEGGRLATRAVEAVRRDDVELADETFTQRFFFVNGQLSQVTLKLNNTRDFDSMLPLVDSLTEIMRDRYGQEVDSEMIQAGAMRQAKVGWIDGNRKIRIFLMSMGEDDSLLNVNYQAYFGG
ncbi:hypothetical protein [Halomonas chromatireducens]|uniref:Uncharacterized protein n=1 Tax=Halomonas chromatireducens TaxID=507626 RepID=A0A0X8HCB0_9GAMM|nr:hypothetical protein [Halomonas chromatireducens]AMC99986.1 hypothetical protein LOKO_00905 [Halomonas chromatireducens]